jgi:hypothetical protein
MADLGVALNRAFREEPWGVLLFTLSILQRSWSERKVVVIAARRWPEAPFPWNRYHVRRLMDNGKRSLDRHLEALAP